MKNKIYSWYSYINHIKSQRDFNPLESNTNLQLEQTKSGNKKLKNKLQTELQNIYKTINEDKLGKLDDSSKLFLYKNININSKYED